MIGNDLVDIAYAHKTSNWQRKGWLQKLFLPSEIDAIHASDHPETLVWTFWSMKEATYKAYQRQFPHPPIFNPTKICCYLDHTTSYHGHSYTTQTDHTKDFIYTTACHHNVSFVSRVLDKEDFSYSSTFIAHIAAHYKIPEHDLQLVKGAYQVPYVWVNGIQTDFYFSFTHHGSFSAYAFGIS